MLHRTQRNPYLSATYITFAYTISFGSKGPSLEPVLKERTPWRPRRFFSVSFGYCISLLELVSCYFDLFHNRIVILIAYEPVNFDTVAVQEYDCRKTVRTVLTLETWVVVGVDFRKNEV